uniref:Uncharacterized protein n=1 Tax=Kwoniella dejecticola CBS 10117 TaxID=1296121 RepID=A0A1A6AE29_9TREE|nr:uncharacterized protein I303_00142 [Kwoniella dejecticola CBS 10117]OBR88331.1 hypothetical protein I303_00142 [Kwoniella dejecticola CBS 10117]
MSHTSFDGISSDIYPPRVRRTVDNVLVLHPGYYPDPGPEGFYPELQYPVQTRLGVRFNPRVNKNVYTQLNAVFMFGLSWDMTEQKIADLLKVVTTESSPVPEMRIRLSPSYDSNNFVVRHSDIHASGFYADSTKDVLIVSEMLALSPPYIPPPYIPLPSPRNPTPSKSTNPDNWHAVGFSRDSFRSKRRSSTSSHWCPPRKRRQSSVSISDEARRSTRETINLSHAVIDPQQSKDETDLQSASDATNGHSDNGLALHMEPKSLLARIDMSDLPVHPLTPPICQLTREDLTRALEQLKELSSKMNLNGISSTHTQMPAYPTEHFTSPVAEQQDNPNARAARNGDHKDNKSSRTKDSDNAHLLRSDPEARKHTEDHARYTMRRSHHPPDKGDSLSDERYRKKTTRNHKRPRRHPTLTPKDLKAYRHHFSSRSQGGRPTKEPKYVGLSQAADKLIFGMKRRDVEMALRYSVCSVDEETSLEKDNEVGASRKKDAVLEQQKAENPSLIIGSPVESEEEEEQIEDERYRPELTMEKTTTWKKRKKARSRTKATSHSRVNLLGSMKFSNKPIQLYNRKIVKIVPTSLPSSLIQRDKTMDKDENEEMECYPPFTIYRVDELSEEVLGMMGFELRYTFNNNYLNSDKAWKTVNMPMPNRPDRSHLDAEGEDEDGLRMIRVLSLDREKSEDRIESILSDSSGSASRHDRRRKRESKRRDGNRRDRTII